MIKDVINKLFRNQIKEDFAVENITSPDMIAAITRWVNIYKGLPDWLDPDDDIRTIKFAKSVCEEVARLASLALGITFDGSRGEYLQTWSDKHVMSNIRQWLEYACAYGTVILKPNGNGVDMVTPDQFYITAVDDDGHITGIVFQTRYMDDKKRWYTRLEYHRIEDNGLYHITNRTYISNSANTIGKPVDIELTRWAGLTEDALLENTSGMLFGVLRMPLANDIELNSCYGVSIFANAIEELKDLDVAYSRNTEEIHNSKKIVLLDERLVQKRAFRDENGNIHKDKLKLPSYVKNVMGSNTAEDFYQEIVPTFNTATRLEGINNLLSMIGYKCGFSNGYFVFDAKTGMVTATQVEADDRRTIQLIKDVRDCLQYALDGLFNAQSIICDLYELAPVGEYEVTYDFGDITYNYEEDRQNWWKYVQAGKVPFWMYLMKFEGFSEEDARALEDEMKAQNESEGLFASE